MIRSCSMILVLLFSVPANAGAVSGWDSYHPIIAGNQLYCTSNQGQPVAFVPNTMLNDVGRAIPGYPPRIEFNPYVLAQFTPKMQLFWYGHECAHHLLGNANNEINADCWSIKTMRNQGLLQANEIPQLMAQIANTPGSIWGHLPGNQRAQLFAQCYLTP